MLMVDPVQYEDLLEIEPQAEQAEWYAETITPETARIIVGNWPGRTVRDEQGRILMCCGVMFLHPDNARLWALFSRRAAPHMHAIVKLSRAFAKECGARRVELTIRSGFASGHKWARLIGFTHEGTMRAYDQQGHDHDLYARIYQ